MPTITDLEHPCGSCAHSIECDRDFRKHTDPKLTESPPPSWGVVPCAPDREHDCETCQCKYLEGCGVSAHTYE